jgi:radical SAM superfamily enzyme YgiQ (UPF0313 family)
MRVLLISTYELGRQPFGLASPAAWLRRAGFTVVTVDVSKTPLTEQMVCGAQLIAFYLPMHTATRLAMRLIGRVRKWNPSAHLCGYGLYAPLNAQMLRSNGVETILGGEFEQDLVTLATQLDSRRMVDPNRDDRATRGLRLPRLEFIRPDRRDLPPLSRYASLEIPDGRQKVVGYTEASRGCKHLCRHCPVVPVYGGQFRIVPAEVVLADIRAQVEQGAEHITFGDPDFFNGILHAVDIVRQVAAEFPGLSYDVTIKIEHLLRHAKHLSTLRTTGCLFVTSAAESVDDAILKRLEKGHTRDDFSRAVALCRQHELNLVPTFVAFNPWITLEGYCDLLQTIDDLNLVGHVAPIQLALRLLITEGSRLLELPDIRELVGPFDSETLVYPWKHPDPGVDDLQRDVLALVGARASRARRDIFDAIFRLAHDRAGLVRHRSRPERPVRDRSTVPYLNEPWYC